MYIAYKYVHNENIICAFYDISTEFVIHLLEGLILFAYQKMMNSCERASEKQGSFYSFTRVNINCPPELQSPINKRLESWYLH